MKYIKIATDGKKVLEDINIKDLTLIEWALLTAKLEQIKFLLMEKEFEDELYIEKE